MLKKIENLIGTKGDSWTAMSYLPGGDFAVGNFHALVHKLKANFDFLDIKLAERLVRSYGTNAWVLMSGASAKKDMGQDFGASLSEREVNYLIQHEWAECADDVIWRRTKLGIHFSETEKKALDKWMSDKVVIEKSEKKLRSENC